jgi:hypothetical protein
MLVDDPIEKTFDLLRASRDLVQLARADKELTQKLLVTTRQAIFNSYELIRRSQ